MKNICLVVMFFWAACVNAQNLPNFLTPAEKTELQYYNAPYHNFAARSYSSSFTPPATAVRTMAEWEEVQGYLIGWTSYSSMLREIVRYGKRECRMYILTSTPGNVITDLQNNGIDTSNITFVNAPFNSVWSRDYGQWCVYTNNVDSLIFIDWMYNRPRPKDDTVPSGLARALNVPIIHTTQTPYDLVHTGGNFMCDGMGTGFSSKLILTDNQLAAGFGVSHTEAEIDTIMSRFMGINRYIKMETLPYDDIHHIDMHMKLLDEETILVGQYPAGIADGPQIEANLQYILSNFKTPFDTDYRVVRIPMPDDNGSYPNSFGQYYTYTNASFINKTIIVPTYNIPEDTTALRIWREACPGYNVVGINSTASISSLGALHCITKEIGADNPLLITHQRLRDTYVTTGSYTATATIMHKNGIQSATLYYTTDTNQAYQAINMANAGNNSWSAAIPAAPTGTEFFYYIKAEAVGGKQQVRPITAPVGFYNFRVLGNTTSINTTVANETEVKDIYPNPAHGITCIPVYSTVAATAQIELYSPLGAWVQHIANTVLAPGENNFFINTTSLPAGVYLVKYNINGAETCRRLVIY